MATLRALLAALLAYFLSGCLAVAPPKAHPLVATTVYLQEVASRLAEGVCEVTLLVPRSRDPHTFQPTPRDLAKLQNCQLLLSNGAGLEGWLHKALEESQKEGVRVIDVSAGLALRRQPQTGEIDPHIWLDPILMKEVTARIAEELTRFEPTHRELFRRRSQRQIAELEELDRWARERLRPIPADRRKLVTAHDALGYFARRYDLDVLGTVIPSASTEAAEASAAEMKDLVQRIRATHCPAIFCEAQQNPKLYRELADEARVELVAELYLDSLGPPQGVAGNYEKAFRWNVERIAEVLR